MYAQHIAVCYSNSLDYRHSRWNMSTTAKMVTMVTTRLLVLISCPKHALISLVTVASYPEISSSVTCQLAVMRPRDVNGNRPHVQLCEKRHQPLKQL